MKKIITSCSFFVFVAVLSLSFNAYAGSSDYEKKVAEDIKKFKALFLKKFPKVDIAEYKNGVYALDAAAREQWLEIEDFPPYELAIDEGEELFDVPFANGKTYGSCFENEGIGVRQNYPYFDTKTNQVITLELAINNCRIANGEAPLKYKNGEIAAISAYMAYTSRGNVFDTQVPNEAAYNAYMKGKQFFYSKRGQLNMACVDCHMNIAGQKLRADTMGPALGHVTGFPVYRSKWEDMGTLHRRYSGCNKNVRAKPFLAQSEEYRNLEYFQTLMSKGMEVNGPSARK